MTMLIAFKLARHLMTRAPLTHLTGADHLVMSFELKNLRKSAKSADNFELSENIASQLPSFIAF
jgi:DNA polymerase III delta subunit